MQRLEKERFFTVKEATDKIMLAYSVCIEQAIQDKEKEIRECLKKESKQAETL